MLFVGIDWSDQALDFQMRDEQDEVRTEGQVKPSVEGLAELFAGLEVHGGPDQIAVILEATHAVWVQPLLDRGYRVYPVNPKLVDSYRESLSANGDKSDRIDRRVLAMYLRNHHKHLRALKPDDPKLIGLRIACQDRLRLMEEHTAKVNELGAVLKGHYPAVLGLFGGLDSDIALAFLEAFPTQDRMRALSEKKLRAWLKAQGYPQPYRIPEMVEHLTQPVFAVAEHLQAAKAPLIGFLARSLRLLNAEIRQRDQDIQDQFEDLEEAKWVRSLPGAGKVLGPAVLACVGRDKTRFADAGKARALFGTAPVTKQSGKFKAVGFRWGCWKFARRTFQLLAEKSLLTCTWAQAFYQQQRAKGHKHHQALRELAHKWVKIILALQRTGQPYDEDTFVNSQRKHRLTTLSVTTVS